MDPGVERPAVGQRPGRNGPLRGHHGTLVTLSSRPPQRVAFAAMEMPSGVSSPCGPLLPCCKRLPLVSRVVFFKHAERAGARAGLWFGNVVVVFTYKQRGAGFPLSSA